MTLIASYTASGTVATIDFTSIPSTYTDLSLQLSLRTNSAAVFNDINLSFNGNAVGFTGIQIQGNGASASSPTRTQNLMLANAATSTSDTFTSAHFYIPNYAGSAPKGFSADSTLENNASTAYSQLTAGLWNNTAAINRITLTPDTASFVIYSSAYLYGVKNA